VRTSWSHPTTTTPPGVCRRGRRRPWWRPRARRKTGRATIDSAGFAIGSAQRTSDQHLGRVGFHSL